MQQKVRFTLVAKLLGVLLTIVIISNVVVGFNVANKSTTAVKSISTEYVDALAQNVSNRVRAVNENEFSLIRSLANLNVLRSENYNLAEKQIQLTEILKGLGDRYQNLAFYDKDGNAIRDNGELLNLANRDYFKTAISGKEVLTDPSKSVVNNMILTYYGVPVMGFDGNPIGALIMLIKGNAIQNLIETIDFGGNSHPYVINMETGLVIASGDSKRDEEGRSPIIDYIWEHKSSEKQGVNTFIDSTENKKMVYTSAPVEGTTWKVYTVAPYEYYMGSIESIKTSTLICIIVTVIISIIISLILIKAITKPLMALKKSITEIASGNADLTKRIENSTNDEIGDVVNGFNSFVEKLLSIVKNLQASKNRLTAIDSELQDGTHETSSSIGQIISNIESVNSQIRAQAGSVEETVSAVNEVNANIESLERMIDGQTSDVQQATSTVEQMIGNINSVNTSVEKMVKSFNQLESNTASGINALSDTNEKIKQIEEQSKTLQDANMAIANIAEQTNLLAMNAAIEAAHAGEAGKGFSVVADEIRKLSETSSQQSKTVGAELDKIHETIGLIVSSTAVTNETFSAVSNNINVTSQIIHQIKSAMEEQQIGSKQIVDALQSMNNSTVEVRQASSEMTTGNRQILGMVSELQSATNNIKQSIGEINTGAQKIDETGKSLTQISSKVKESVSQIGNEVDLFKI